MNSEPPNTRVRRTHSSSSPFRTRLTGGPPGGVRRPRYPIGLLVLIAAIGSLGLSGCAAAGAPAAIPASAAEVCGAQDLSLDPGVTPPRLIHRIEPKVLLTDASPAYACVEGTVRTDGTVTDLRVLRASSADMATRALDAVRGWRYSPAIQNGVPIEAPVKIGFFVRVTSA